MKPRCPRQVRACREALLIVCVLALAPPASAAGKLPKVTYTVPSAASDATAVTTWSGNSVTVNYEPGSSPVDAAKSQLFINGTKVPLSQAPVDMSMVGGAGVQFPIPGYHTGRPATQVQGRARHQGRAEHRV